MILSVPWLNHSSPERPAMHTSTVVISTFFAFAGSDQSANSNRTAKYVVVIAVLSILLAAAAGYILYLKRIIRWGNCCCCNREGASDSRA